jgi:hypothetical protein
MGAIIQEKLEAGAHRPKDLGWKGIVECHASLVRDAVYLDETDELAHLFGCNALLAKKNFNQGNNNPQLEDHLVIVHRCCHILLGLGLDLLITLCQSPFLIDHGAD